MSFDELRATVKEKLNLRACNIGIKLGYQYAEWLDIDDGDESSRQLITNDHEVEVFVHMRRKIEEVKLCVIVSLNCNGISAQLPMSDKMHYAPTETEDDEDGTSEDEGSKSDETWHDFAMSETPLTLPPSLTQDNVADVG
ncbi:unnamed protein product [Arabis nemorensis]|uniref:Uncharacterized protein n=1 Tax=Arabis nemorensis TaxID=586526 RepID=A0A565C3R9_9BRAS|nr:unnamed protein product [Arabis nemorensis]